MAGIAMKDSLDRTPSGVAKGQYVIATCKRCGYVWYPHRDRLLALAGDIPLRWIQPHVRCVARLGDKRGPACGGATHLELCGPRLERPAAG